jgi:uncharacterized protein YlxP (DUF503 family)
MFVGILQFELRIDGALSLKDKRRVVKSVKDRLHRDHLVSVAETDAINHLRTAMLSVAMVSATQGPIGRTFDRILEKLRALTDAELIDFSRDLLRGDQLPDQNEAALWSPEERRADAGVGT